MIIANVEVEVNVSDERYKPLISKFEGTHCLDSYHRILLGKNNKDYLPTIKAEASDSWGNIEYVLGINKILVREDHWPHKPVREEDYEPYGHAHSLQNYPELDIQKNEAFPFRGSVVDWKERKKLKEMIKGIEVF